MRKQIIKLLIKIQRKARKKSLQQAIELAKQISDRTNKKVLIYFIEGQYEVLTKQQLKASWHKGVFNGKTIQEMEALSEIKIQKR